MDFPLWTIFLATLGLVWYYRKRKMRTEAMKGLKEIPGPKGLPIIGNAHQIGNNLNKQFCKWNEEFGPIIQAKLGGFTFISVADPKMVKEIFSNDPLLTGKILFSEFSMYEDDPQLGMFNSEGDLWEVHRRFLLRQLRDFGFGKSSMETLIMEEVEEVMNRYKKTAGKPVSQIKETMRLAVVNSLWKILTSNRFDHDDPELLKLSDNTSKAFNEVFENALLLLFMPLLKHFIPDKCGYTKIRRVLESNKTLFERTLKEHKENFDPDNLKDFMDVYLAEAKKADSSSTFYGERGERQLCAMLFDLFLAGSDTTSITLSWCLIYLCKFKTVQEKLREEIDQITGNSRRPSLTDRPNMPYTMAFIDEVLRHSSAVPDGVNHRAMADREFQGYYIPKDALVQPNLYFISHSDKYFPDAEKFNPERFLSSDGKKYIKNENLQPFQIGRRQCVGESLARDSVFLFLTYFFQTFEMKFDPDSQEPSYEAEVGFLRSPLPFSLIMTERI